MGQGKFKGGDNRALKIVLFSRELFRFARKFYVKKKVTDPSEKVGQSKVLMHNRVMASHLKYSLIPVIYLV